MLLHFTCAVDLSEGSRIQCFKVGSVLMDTTLDTQGVVQPTS
jgi:hypothetical protein